MDSTWSFGMALLVLWAALLRVNAGAVVTAPSKWSPCASKSYAVSITDVLISPDPVVAGDVATFTIPAYSELKLEGGTVVVTVLFHGIRVHTERDDLCSKTPCPIQGEFTLTNSESLPALTPPGTYTLKFQVLDTNGAELTCASVTFSIVWKLQSEQLMDAAEALYRKINKRDVAVV